VSGDDPRHSLVFICFCVYVKTSRVAHHIQRLTAHCDLLVHDSHSQASRNYCEVSGCGLNDLGSILAEARKIRTARNPDRIWDVTWPPVQWNGLFSRGIAATGHML
jgi:hypothetical protein